MITLTIDLEDPTARYEPGGRYAVMARRILDICDELKCRATFFTVGRIAEAAPQLIKDIAAKGHEIAYHSHAHVPLTEDEPMRFRLQAGEDKDRLENLAGKAVAGFRAPRFSLVPQNASWVLGIIREIGFRYSSSVMPTGLSLYGFKNAPRMPFCWPNGIIELPLPVTKTGLPYLGGIYLYSLPFALARRAALKADAREVLWTYAHPYDFDREEKFAPMPGTPLWMSYVLWRARRKAEDKIRKILALGTAPPLGERLASLTSLDTYS